MGDINEINSKLVYALEAMLRLHDKDSLTDKETIDWTLKTAKEALDFSSKDESAPEIFPGTYAALDKLTIRGSV